MQQTREESPEELPTDAQMGAWYDVLRRIVEIGRNASPLDVAYAPSPLKADIQDCVDRGFLTANQAPESEAGSRCRLCVTDKGAMVFDMLHSHLVATGQAEPVNFTPEESQSNPFDGMD